MVDEIDRERASDSQINTDDLDLGSIDDIELDLPDVDGDEGVQKGSGRKPTTSKKQYALDAAKHLAGGVKAIGAHELKKAMPDAALIVSDVTSTLNDIKELRDELSKQLAPITRSFVTAGRKLMPAAESILPKKIYQAVEKKLKEKEAAMQETHYQGPSKEQQETSQIQAELAAIFDDQNQIQMARDRDEKKELMVDRAMDSIRHKQTTVQLTHLYDAMRSTELFHKTQHLAYMKKSLELKYRHIFIARDTFNLLQTSMRSFEGYYKALVTNTSLPDMMKTKARDLIYKSRTDKWGGMMASAMNNIRGKIFDKIKESARGAMDVLSTAAMAAESGADAYEMAREFGGKQKGLPGWALKGAGALAAWGPFNAFVKRHRGMFDALNTGAAGIRANMATTLAEWREKAAGSNNYLMNMLADLLPNPFAQQTSASNDMLSKAHEAAVFDVVTRQSIVEVIPGYLGKIWHEIAMMRTGNDNLEERTFNVYQRRFTGVDEFKADVTEKAFGKEETRRGFLNKTIAFMQAGAARNNGGKVTIGGTERNVADMYKGMEKDINRVFINHAVTGRPFSPGKLRDFVMDPNNCDRSYITAITTGVKGNSHDVIEAICAAMFTTDGKLDRQAYNKINLAITENYRQQDSYRQSLAEVAETFGQGQFLSGGLTAKQEADLRALARSEDEDVRKQAIDILEKNAGLISRSVSESRINMESIANARNEMDFDLVEADKFTREHTYKGFQNTDEQMESLRSKMGRMGNALRRGRDKLAGLRKNKYVGRAVDAGLSAAEAIARGVGKVTGKATEHFTVAGRGRGAEYEDVLGESTVTPEEAAEAGSFTDRIKAKIEATLKKGKEVKTELASSATKEQAQAIFDGIMSSLSKGGAAAREAFVKLSGGETPPPTPPTGEGTAETALNASLGVGSDNVVEDRVSNIGGEVFDNILAEIKAWRQENTSNQGTIFDAVAQLDDTIRGLQLTQISGGAEGVPTIAFGASSTAPKGGGGRLKGFAGGMIRGAGSLIKGVGKMYTRIYGAALKGAGTAISGIAGAASNLLGGIGRGLKGIAKWATGKEDYVDVYVKGKENRPIVSARMQREEGIYFKANGKRVMKSADIDQECVDKDGNLVVTEEDLNAGLVMPNGTPLGKLGRGLLSLGKSYFGLYGKALGAIGTIASAAIGAMFGTKADKYVDIYRKDEVAKGPLVTARLQKNEGIYHFDNGQRVEKSSDIHGPVTNRKREVLITAEDVEHGLVDVNNKPLGSRKTGLMSGTGGLLAGIGTAIGAGAKGLFNIYSKVYTSAIDLISGGLKGAGKFLGRALGLDTGKGTGLGGEADKEVRDAIIGSYSTLKLMQLDLALIADQYRKKNSLDKDGDGDIDGSYKDQMEKRGAGGSGSGSKIDHKDVNWLEMANEAEAAEAAGEGGGEPSLMKRWLFDKTMGKLGKKLGRGKGAWRWARKLRAAKYLGKKRALSGLAKGGKAALSGGKGWLSSIGSAVLGKGATTAVTGGLTSTAAGASTAAAGAAGTAAASTAAGAAGSAATAAGGGAVAHGLGAGLKTVAGKAALPVALALEAGIGGYKAYGAYKQGKLNKGDDTVGRTTNAMIGTALGAAIGSIVPGLGTALGAAIGGAVGGLGGGMVKKNLITGIIKAVRGNDNEMTEKEIEYGRRKLQRKVDKNVPGYDRILQEYEKAVEAKNWARARGLCGKEADSAITALWKNSWTGQLVNGTINLMFGDKNAEMTKEEIDKTRAKFQSVMKKGGMAAKNAERLLDKFDDAVAEGNWKEARKIAGAEKRGLFGKLFQDSKGNIQWGRLIGTVLTGGAGYFIGSLFDKTDVDKPMTDKEIKEALAWFDKQIAAGGRTKSKVEKIKEEFQAAVTEQNWKKARKLCGKEVKSSLQKLGSAAKFMYKWGTGIGIIHYGLTGDQDTPMTDAEIKSFRDKMTYLITKKNDKLAERKLDKFDEYISRQQWEKARHLAKMPHKGWIVRAAKAYHAFWWGDDEAAMTEAEVNKARESMQRKVKLGIKGAQKKLDAFEDAVGTQKWRKARAIAKMPDEGVMQKTGKGLAVAARYFWGGNEQYMDNEEIEKARKIMTNAIADGKKGAKKRLELFEDAVADENWKKARYLARMPYEAMGKRIKNWWLGGDKHKELDPEEIEEFRSQCEAAIAEGNKGAKKRLEEFNAAVATENWEKARRISKIKDEGAWGSIKSGTKKFMNWLTGNKDRKDCEEMREELEDRAMEDNTGILNAGLDQFNAYVRRRQFNRAIALGKDMLKLKPDQFAKKYKFSSEKLKKLAEEANKLADTIHKEQEENNSWKHPIKEMQLSRLRSRVLNNSDQWGEEFFNEVKDELGEITEKAEYLSDDSRPDDKTVEAGNKLIERIENQYNQRSWWKNPIVKWQLNSLKNEVKSNVTDWDDTMFDTWEERLEEIDDTYKSERLAAQREEQTGDDKETKKQKQLRKKTDKLIETINQVNSKYSWLGSPFVKTNLSSLKNEIKSENFGASDAQFMDWYNRLMEIDADGELDLKSVSASDIGRAGKEFTAILRMKKKFAEDAAWLRSQYTYAASPKTCWNLNSAKDEALAGENGALTSGYKRAKEHFDYWYRRLKEIDDNDDSEIDKKRGGVWQAYSIEDLNREQMAEQQSQDRETAIAERQKVIDLWNKYVALHNSVHNSKSISDEEKSKIYPICNWIEGWIKSRVGNAYYDGSGNGGKGSVVESLGNGKTRAESSPRGILEHWRSNPEVPPPTKVVKNQIALAIKKLTQTIKELSSVTKVDDIDLATISEDNTESEDDVKEHDSRWKLWKDTVMPFWANVEDEKKRASEQSDPLVKTQMENDLALLSNDALDYKRVHLPGGTYEAWANMPKEPPSAKDLRNQFQRFKARLRKINPKLYEGEDLEVHDEDDMDSSESELDNTFVGTEAIKKAIEFYGPIEVQNSPWLANVARFGDKAQEEEAASKYAGVPSRDDVIKAYGEMQRKQEAEGNALAEKVKQDLGEKSKKEEEAPKKLTHIAGEPIGEKLSAKQLRDIERGLDNGTKYPKEILDKYFDQKGEKEERRLNNGKTVAEIMAENPPPPLEPWELDFEGFGDPEDERYSDQCIIAGEKVGAKLSAKQVAAIKQGLGKGENYPAWLMKRYQEATAPKPKAAAEQAKADVGTPSNKEAIAAQNQRIRERIAAAKGDSAPAAPSSSIRDNAVDNTKVEKCIDAYIEAYPNDANLLTVSKANGMQLKAFAEKYAKDTLDLTITESIKFAAAVYKAAKARVGADSGNKQVTTSPVPAAQADLGSAPAKPTIVIKSDMEQGADYVMGKLSDRAGYMAEAKRFGLDPKMSGLLVRKLAREFAEDHLDMENEIDIERFVKGVQLSVNAAGVIKPPEEPQGEVIDDGTYDEVRHQKSENGFRTTRSGLRIGGDPISKSGLTDKQMGLVGMAISMSGEVRDASGKVISPGRQPYPDYVMEMYNKQLPEYQARMAEKRKNAPASEEFGLGGFINNTASGFDADGNPIVIGEEQVPEAIVPLANKPGNLLNRLGSKIKELLTKKTEEATSDASVHASEEAAGPLIDKLAAHVVDASGLGMPSVLGKIGKRMQNLFSSESTDTLSPEDAGAPSLFDRIKKGAIDFKDNLLAKPSEAVRSMLAAEETQPDLTAQQQSETTPAGPTTVEFKGAADMLKSQGAMTDQVKEMKDAALKLYTLLAEAFTQSGIKVQGIGELAQICAAGVASGQNGQPQPEVQVVPVPHEQDSGIDLRKRQA